MDPNQPSSSPRKVRYPPKKKGAASKDPNPKLVIPKKAEDDQFDPRTQQSLLRKAEDLQTRRKPNAKKELQLAPSHGGASAATANLGRERETTSDAAYSKASPLSVRNVASSLSAGGPEGVGEDSGKKKEYQEPWDYENSYYPITLPLRRPGSGDPKLLDKAEFEEALEYDENALSSASALGLQRNQEQDETPKGKTPQDETPQMLFFKFPSQLPLKKQATSNSNKGKGIAGSSKNELPSSKCSSLEELPQGYVGKMLVYKSGAVKLKLGDILYDVSPGIECSFPQNVMAINTESGQCYDLGGVTKHAVVTPEIDSLLGDGSN